MSPGKEMQESFNMRLAVAPPLATARAASSMATKEQHFCGALVATWGDHPPDGLGHILLGARDSVKGRTEDYIEFYEVAGKLWVLFPAYGFLVYSREGGNMTEQQGHVPGRPGAELFSTSLLVVCQEALPSGCCTSHTALVPPKTACSALP